MPDTNDDIISKLTEMLGSNTKVMQEVLDKIQSLENKVAEQTEQLETVSNQLAAVTEKQEIFNAHLGQIYNSQSIEETLTVMGNMGKDDMEVDECSVFSYDALENKLFTVDEDGKRVYTDISDETPVGAAFLKNEMFFQEQYEGKQLGDGKDDFHTKNAAVIPIESKTGDVIGVVVVKDKKKTFSKEDARKFDLKDGKIGSAFRIGLENKALRQAAVTDRLTHLHNRQGAEQFLQNTVLPKLMRGDKMSTIMLDIDKFKNFNDTYGHDVGDKVLQQVAQILKDNVRSGDGVFRWGGEEMVFIAAMNTAEAYALAERLRSIVENTPLEVNGELLSITVSMGVAGISAESIEQLDKGNIFQFFEEQSLKLADERLYEAKESGRNRVVAPKAIMEKYGQKQKNNSIKTFVEDKKAEKDKSDSPEKHRKTPSKKNEIE